jgi:hypothetical protein
MRKRTGLIAALAVSMAFAAVLPARSAELVMFESDSCEWCEAWHKEIGPIYPKTRESQLAPLRRVSIEDPVPDDLAHLRAVMFTPTFVLMEDGKEVGRITGYPGDSFFWPLLDEQLAKLDSHSTVEADSACAKNRIREESDENNSVRSSAC